MAQINNDEYTVAKSTVRKAVHKGSFLKRCPCTAGHTCCGYMFLNVGTNCPIDCTYCILQDYIGPEPVTAHTNIDDMLAELDETFGDGRFRRIGTGELTDSLAIDHITGYTKQLVPFFARRDNAVLELKTKTVFVDNLKGLQHGGRTIVAWSLNPQSIIDSDEHGSASLPERIDAAEACVEAGYRLAFHFDPLIQYPDWRCGYAEVAAALGDSSITQDDVAWISLGCLRFPPGMPAVVERRFPESVLRTGEFVTGKDGKARYFKPIRIEMYREVARLLKNIWPDVFLYLCMENQEVWKSSLGWSPSSKGLSELMDVRGGCVG